MKQFLCVLLMLCLCFRFAGCAGSMDDSITFYYCRDPKAYQYYAADAVVATERRDLSGHRNDVPYLLRLYLAGPLEEDLQSPFPRNTHLIHAGQDAGRIEIDLSSLDETMTDASFSLACACLTKTCIDYFGCEEVTVRSGSRSITMSDETIVLFDNGPQEATNGGQS